MSIDEKDLAPFDISVAISQVDLSVPQGFHLRSPKGNTGLIGLFNKVIMKSLFILTNQFLFFGHSLETAKRMEHSA